MGRKIQSIGKYKFCYETLGKGSFARVELVIHEVTKCKVAMKIINTRKITEDYIRNNLYREARILSQLNHPNIIKFYESLRADIYYCLITECAHGGDLAEYMKTFDYKRFPEDVARYYLRQLISAIQYMHEKGVVHRDLKMENLMLDKTKRHLKLIDFGLSNNLPRNELLMTHCGSPEYAAPELFTTNALYGPEVDIWSFGIVLYACVTGDLPFFSPYYDHARRQRLLVIINKGLTAKHTKEMEHLSTECKDLIKDVLEPLPQLRIPMDEIINHRWVTNSDQIPFTPYFPKPKPPELKSQTGLSRTSQEFVGSHAFSSADNLDHSRVVHSYQSSSNYTLVNQDFMDISATSTEFPHDLKSKEESIIEKLAEFTSLNKTEIERFVHENGTNELSAMFKMLLEETKVEMGYYEEDHTNRPLSVVNERKRQLARLKWRKLRYRLKESARIFRELINSKQQSNGAGKSESFDNKDKAIFQASDPRPNKVKVKPRVNPVGIVKTEKKKEFFPPKRSAMQPAISVESNRSLTQLKNIRSRVPNSETISNQISLPVLSDPSPKRCNSLIPSQRKVTSNPPNLQNDMSCSNKDISRTLKSNSAEKKPQSVPSELSHKSTYRSTQKNLNVDLPKVPLANINEVYMDNLETTSNIDFSEPRYCLVKVTESDLSSGLLISSTISEISEGRSMNSYNLENAVDNLEVNDSKNEDTTDSGTPTTVICSQTDSHHLCNGDIPANDLL